MNQAAADPMALVSMIPGENFGKKGDISSANALTFAKSNAAFKEWVQKISTTFAGKLSSIQVLQVYPFISYDKPLGFVIAQANVKKGGIDLPGFAFIRGGAVAVLPILKTPDGQKYVLTTVQPRIPGASAGYEEIPAGMVDGARNFGGVAAKEMKEETGLIVKESELTPLCEMYPSIGGCDEKIKIYCWEATIGAQDLADLEGLATGALEENEAITLKVRPYEEFKNACLTSEISDVKAQNALGMYEMLKARGTDMAGAAFKPEAVVPEQTVKAAMRTRTNQNTGFGAMSTNVFQGGRRRNRKQKKTQRKQRNQGGAARKQRNTRKQ